MRRALLALGVAAAAAASLAPAAGAAYRYADAWGGEGRPTGSDFELTPGMFSDGRLPARFAGIGVGDRQYNSPGGLAFARNGDVFVADTANNRIQRFTAAGRFIRAFGRFGFDPGARRVGARGGHILVQGLAADAAGNLFVADNRNDRVVKWSAGGRFLARLGRRGSLRGQMVSPWGVAVDRGVVYVVDQGNARIMRFSTRGRFLGSFGSFGTARRHFRAPYGVAARGGAVFVSDTFSDTIKVFTTRGRYLRSFGGRGDGPGRLDQPAGLAIDPAGRLHVADCRNQRMMVFTASGAFVESYGEGVLRDPTFPAINSRGQVFVSDYRRVVRFDPAPRGTHGGRHDRPPGYLACVSQAEGTQSETPGLGPEDG